MKGAFKIIQVFGLITLLFSCSAKNDDLTFETTEVKKRDVVTSIVATGIVKPKVGAEVRVGSRVSGIVKKLYVKNGDLVQKGKLLAVLDDAELLARLNLEEANLQMAKTNQEYAKKEMVRVKGLVDKEFTSEQSWDDLVKKYDVSSAQVKSQQAMVDYARTQLGFTKIYAPISGVISAVNTQEGETVAAAFAAPVFVSIINPARIEIRAYVDETDIGRVETGQLATFTVDTYPGYDFKGKVSAIYPKAEIRDNVVNYIAIIEIDSAKGKQLRPEMTAYVTLITETVRNALAIPNNLISRQGEEAAVYVLEDNHPVLRKIKTGTRGNQLTEVLSGLSEGELIVSNPNDDQIN
ncbi:MAG TPA: efflux RND transporter periplasmic adaptor subunit [Bacteroidales bacterium]|nr:efflux RND transporter periplasmic adaptor subunit [Bacteroidales bacterium]